MPQRIVFLAAALLMLAVTAFAAVPISTDAIAALVDEDGRILFEGEEIETIFEVEAGALYAAGKKGAYQLVDAAGRCVCERVFSMIREADGWLIFREEGFYGVMNRSGEIVVEPVWTQLVSNGAGGFLALNGFWTDEQPDTVWVLKPGEEPEMTENAVVGGLSDISEDRMPFMTTAGRWGYLNGRGEVAVEARWLSAGAFENGVALVTGEHGRGLIDRDGRSIVEADRPWMERGKDLIAAMTAEGRLEVLSADGRELRFSIACESAQVVGGALCAIDAQGVRLYRADGTLICDAAPATRFLPGSDGQFIAIEGSWGELCQRLMDEEGRFLSEPRQRLMPLCPGLYQWMEMDGVTYYSADLGGLQTSWDYDSVRWGLMDGEGREVQPALFREIRAVGEDRLLLIGDQTVILADMEGSAIRVWLTVEDETPSDEAGA